MNLQCLSVEGIQVQVINIDVLESMARAVVANALQPFFYGTLQRQALLTIMP